MRQERLDKILPHMGGSARYRSRLCSPAVEEKTKAPFGLGFFFFFLPDSVKKIQQKMSKVDRSGDWVNVLVLLAFFSI